MPASTGVSRALPSTGPSAGGVGSYPRGARGLRLRGLLHLPITHSTPAAGWRTQRALESGSCHWEHNERCKANQQRRHQGQQIELELVNDSAGRSVMPGAHKLDSRYGVLQKGNTWLINKGSKSKTILRFSNACGGRSAIALA